MMLSLFDILDILIKICSLLTGIIIICGTLLSVLRTYVLARSAPDAIAALVMIILRRIFVMVIYRADSYEQRDRVMAFYAPVSLFVLPLVWMSFITIGFACVYIGLGVTDIAEALIISGSSLMTLGFASTDVPFLVLLEILEAAIGLLLVALFIAYLPTMYAAFSKREVMVTMMEVYAGTPPTPQEMLLRLHRIEGLDDLNDLWDNWRLWFAELEESHTSLAMLVFFRSTRPERFWLTTAGVILDTASIYASSLDIERNPKTELCIRSGYITLRYLADFFGIEYRESPAPEDEISISREEFFDVYDELAEKGLPVKPDREQCWQDFRGWRVNYDDVILPLSVLTFAPYAPWTSDRAGVMDNQFSIYSRFKF